MRRSVLPLIAIIGAAAFSWGWLASGAQGPEARVTRATTQSRLALLSVEGAAAQSERSDVTATAGAECPTGSGNFCSDELPYCCPGINVAPYCATDVSGCTE
jgi:hypothetical protein